MAATRSSPARPRAASTASPASVRRYVALSIVAIDRTDNGYFRAKLVQEKLIEAYIPYTIIRATQFMEFLGGIADSSADGKIQAWRPTNRKRRVSGSETMTNQPNDNGGGVRYRYPPYAR